MFSVAAPAAAIVPVVPSSSTPRNTFCAFSRLSSIVWFKVQSRSLRVRSSSSSFVAMAAADTPEATSSASSGVRQALISLSDKKDLAFLGSGLQELGFKILSTGETASALEDFGVSVTKVEEITCFPELLHGHAKTLHPNIHGGISALRDQKHHVEALDKHGIGMIDVVVVNLYPLYDKVTSSGQIEFEDGMENIDIGGPEMITAAAKNCKHVLVIVDSQDYPALLDFLKGKEDDQQFRRKLACKAFQHVVAYESAVSEWLWKHTVGGRALT